MVVLIVQYLQLQIQEKGKHFFKNLLQNAHLDPNSIFTFTFINFRVKKPLVALLRRCDQNMDLRNTGICCLGRCSNYPEKIHSTYHS